MEQPLNQLGANVMMIKPVSIHKRLVGTSTYTRLVHMHSYTLSRTAPYGSWADDVRDFCIWALQIQETSSGVLHASEVFQADVANMLEDVEGVQNADMILLCGKNNGRT